MFVVQGKSLEVLLMGSGYSGMLFKLIFVVLDQTLGMTVSLPKGFQLHLGVFGLKKPNSTFPN